MIYLDNAATTLVKPKEVYAESDRVFRHFSANPGRSGHRISLEALDIVTRARSAAADFFEIEKSENAVFTFGCTDALNILLQGLFTKGDHVLATAYEHNSVLRPLEYMKTNKGVEYSIVFPDENESISIKNLKNHLKKNTKGLVANYVSNVTGFKQNIDLFADFCKKHGLLFIVDCAQAAGTQEISMKKIDYIACAGHKGLYGPQGIGILGAASNVPLPEPLRFGGTGSRSLELVQPAEMPEHLESGTLSVQNIAALKAGIDFVKENRPAILKKETELITCLKEELKKTKNITVYSKGEPESGVIAFNIADADSAFIADILDKQYGICCRGGFHCAPMVHRFLKTENQGAVRMSVSYFNTISEIFYTAEKLREIAKRI